MWHKFKYLKTMNCTLTLFQKVTWTQSWHSQCMLSDSSLLDSCRLWMLCWSVADCVEGRLTDPSTIIQTDQSLWTYRNQVINTPHMSPFGLFFCVKATEALYHLRYYCWSSNITKNASRPQWLKRLFIGGDKRVIELCWWFVDGLSDWIEAEYSEVQFVEWNGSSLCRNLWVLV